MRKQLFWERHRVNEQFTEHHILLVIFFERTIYIHICTYASPSLFTNKFSTETIGLLLPILLYSKGFRRHEKC